MEFIRWPLDAVADYEFAFLQACFQTVYVNFYVVGDGMAGREVFGFDLGAAAGAVEFHDADPERVGGEIECAGDEGRMDFARVALVDQATFFVIFAGGAERAIASVAGPLVVVEIEV